MLLKIIGEPNFHSLFNSRSFSDLFLFQKSYPQEGIFCEVLKLIKPFDEDNIIPEIDNKINIEHNNEQWRYLRAQIKNIKNSTWREFAKFRMRAIKDVPKGSRVIITGGGCNIYKSGEYDIEGREVIVHHSNYLGVAKYAIQACSFNSTV